MQSPSTTTIDLDALWGALFTHYGPIAFGLVALLILWARIVKPQLDSNKPDLERVERLARINHETAVMLNGTSLALRESIAVLKEVTDELRVARACQGTKPA